MAPPLRAILIAGCSGFVGQHLATHLHRLGLPARCSSRFPARARQLHPRWDWIAMDVERPATLASALEGCRAVVYLVHDPGGHRRLDLWEERAAERLLAAAERAGTERIVYLAALAGGSRLESRQRTGEILRGGRVSTIELRASLIVGAEGESWRIVRDVASRLPVMLVPRWLDHRLQPVAVHDVVHALAHAIDNPLVGSGCFGLPGPETLTFPELLARVAHAQGLDPVMIPTSRISPWLSELWLRLVTRANQRAVHRLVAGLSADLVAHGECYWNLMPGYQPLPFDEAARRALAAEERSLPARARALEQVVRWLAPRYHPALR